MMQEISKYVNQSLSTTDYKDNVLCELYKTGYVDVSIYKPVVFSPDEHESSKQREDYHRLISLEIAELAKAFPISKDEDRRRSFYSILMNVVEEDMIPVKRLHDAIQNLIRTNTYQSFVPAQILSYDKRIVFGRTPHLLREKLNRPVDWEDIVVVKMYDADYGEYRAYAHRKDAEDIMKDRIIGTWDSVNKCWNWIGEIVDSQLEGRKLAFRKSLYPFCINHPSGIGKYAPEDVREFFEYYSQVLPPGDMMLFESKINWDSESYLDSWMKKKGK